MTTMRLMYDDVDVALLPSDAQVLAFYIDGIYANGTAIRARFPHATLVPIAVRSSATLPKVKRLWLDDEPGDASNAQAVAWYHLAKAAGVETPGFYTSVSNVEALIAVLEAAGLRFGIDFLVWSAHYTYAAHVCGPQCGFGLRHTVHGTQYTDRSEDRSLDASEVTPRFLGTDSPKPAPKPKPAKFARGVAHFSGSVNLTTGEWTVHRLPGTARWGSDVRDFVAEVAVKDGAWRIVGVPRDTKPLG